MAELDPGTDSTVDATTPRVGTADPANDQPGSQDGSGAEAPASGFDEAFLKGLATLDPSKVDPTTLPKEFNDRFVSKAEFTRKSQALADEKRQLADREKAVFDLARKAIADRDIPKGPTPAQVKYQQLLELAAAGDKDALDQAIDMRSSEKIAPIQTETAWRNAAETALRLEPAVKEHWAEIQATLAQDPELAEMARANGFKNAAKVMMALGFEHKIRDQATALTAKDGEVTALKAKLAAYEKERVSGLPASTTKAGSTAGRPAAGDFDDIHAAGMAAWIEAGGKREDYR